MYILSNTVKVFNSLYLGVQFSNAYHLQLLCISLIIYIVLKCCTQPVFISDYMHCNSLKTLQTIKYREPSVSLH